MEVIVADNNRASLGCGAFLLVVMAGLFFFRPGMSELEREVHNLRADVGQLKTLVESQSADIKALHDKLERSNGKEKPPAGVAGQR